MKRAALILVLSAAAFGSVNFALFRKSREQAKAFFDLEDRK